MAEPTAPGRSAADRLNWALMNAGWRLAPRLPTPVLAWLTALAGRAALAADLGPVETYRRNLEVALGRPVAPGLIRHGVSSYLRMWREVLSLSGWPGGRIVDSVTTDPVGEAVLREAAAGPGVVVALPHQGNWDLAGAWACTTGLPVSTVAEELNDEEYRAFTAFRSGLGMRVYGHRESGLLPRLAADLGQGRVICLLADRNFLGRGLAVDWPTPTGHSRVSLPAGPALLARRSGAVLLGAACTYRGARMHISFGRPVEHRPGRDGLVAMTQEVASFFAGSVQRQPQDWHMMQPFFPGVRPLTGPGEAAPLAAVTET